MVRNLIELSPGFCDSTDEGHLPLLMGRGQEVRESFSVESDRTEY